MHSPHDSKEKFISIYKWKQAALKDGWDIKPTYKTYSDKHYATLSKDGFIAHINLNIFKHKVSKNYVHAASISIWEPDGKAIEEPDVYSFDELIKNASKCDFCNQYVDEVFRVAFANKACKKCVQEAKEKFEMPGWYN